jgi:hypothetical protein
MQLGSTPDELSWISKFGEARRLQWRHASYCVASAGLEDSPPSQSVIVFHLQRPDLLILCAVTSALQPVGSSASHWIYGCILS